MNDQTRPNSINTEKYHRLSFLLRLWCADEAGRSNWQASLEMPGIGRRIGFACLEQLFVYLLDLCENRNDVEDKEAKSGKDS
jgi:hypothetical protein